MINLSSFFHIVICEIPAKSALVGFSNSLAQEGAKYNIISNAIIPTAGSRLTQTVLPETLIEALKPEFVTPLAVYLCHDSFSESGKVFEAGAGWYGTLKYYRSAGKVIPHATVEDLRDNWNKITDMKDAQHFENMKDLMAELISAMSEVQENGSENHTAPAAAAPVASGDFPSHIKCSPLFKEMNEGVKEDPSSVKNIKAIVLYILTDGKKEIGKYTLDFKSASPSVYYGDVKNGEKPSTVVTVSDNDFFEIASGNLNPQKARSS
ncbi:unnamed protein product [Strongylus vulgaris]|uniref:SCP2 domain-containing protein n=1 Tax=Strongylus vulgaris TaxID=40348 RepID=A0A3P7JCS5_STRVU|nr:unnamed protein product [Strongylus vulgaris]